jgi:DNA-binding NtrC family response regulator
MNILLLDDLRDLMRVYTEKLEAGGHEVRMVGDMGTAQLFMKKATADNKPFLTVNFSVMETS